MWWWGSKGEDIECYHALVNLSLSNVQTQMHWGMHRAAWGIELTSPGSPGRLHEACTDSLEGLKVAKGHGDVQVSNC